MFSRRSFVLGTGAVSLAGASGARAQSSCTVLTEETQTAITPRAAIELLKAGNHRFIDGKTINCDLKAQLKSTAGGQHPFAAVVGCIDSRVPPELLFDQHIGSIFVARVAGNIINNDILGSLEYACEHAGAKAILVLGHKGCGAVKAAIEDLHEGHLTGLLSNIRPVVVTAKAPGAREASNAAFFDQVVIDNAKRAGHEILRRSHGLNELVREKKLIVAVAVDDVSTGKVEFIEEIHAHRDRKAKHGSSLLHHKR